MTSLIYVKLINHEKLKNHPIVKRHKLLLKMLHSLEAKKNKRAEKEIQKLIEEIEINTERLKEIGKHL